MSSPAPGWLVLGPFCAPKPVAFLVLKLVRARGYILIGSGASRNEPYRYAIPKTAEVKLSKLRVKATGQRHKGGSAKPCHECPPCDISAPAIGASARPTARRQGGERQW
jgi:hypothetical protein